MLDNKNSEEMLGEVLRIDDSSSSNVKSFHSCETNSQSQPFPLKKAWLIGPNLVTVIDKSIVRCLGISEENTLFRQEIVQDGILLRIVKKDTAI